MNVLVITSRAEAKHQGCRPDSWKHRTIPNLWFWWPELGDERLCGCRFDLVIKDRNFTLNSLQVAVLTARLGQWPETLFVEARELGGCVLLEAL